MIFIMLFKPNFITLVLFLTLVIVTLGLSHDHRHLNKEYHGISDFGMNKAHLLFHLGERSKVAVNYGFGYWQNMALK